MNCELCLDTEHYKLYLILIKRRHYASVGFRNIINMNTLPYKSQFSEHCDCIAFVFCHWFLYSWGKDGGGANQKVTTNIWNYGIFISVTIKQSIVNLLDL